MNLPDGFVTKSSSSFHLMSPENNVITKIKEAALYVRKVKLNPSITLTHSKLLDQGKLAKYPVRRGIVTSFTIYQNSLSFNKGNVVSGQLPRRVVVGFVRNAAFNGCERKPFQFSPFRSELHVFEYRVTNHSKSTPQA